MSARRQSAYAPILADLLEADLDDLENDDSQLGKVLAGLGADEGFVTVTKYDSASPNSSGWAACCKVPLSEFEPFTVASVYGAGKYRFRICQPNGRVVTNVTREFVEPRRPVSAPGLPAAAPAAAPASDRLSQLERSLEESRVGHQRFLETLLTTLLTNQTGGGTDVKAMLDCFREGRDSRPEVVTPPHETVLEGIRLGLELKQNAGETGDAGGTVLERMAPRVMGLLERALGPAGAPAAGASSGAPALPDATAPAQLPGNGDAVAGMVAHYAPYLIREAEAGHDPELWAEWLLERTPDVWRPPLLRLAYAPAPSRHQLMAQIHSGLPPYFPWIDRACAALVALTTGDDAGETDDDQEPERDTATKPAGGPVVPPAQPAG